MAEHVNNDMVITPKNKVAMNPKFESKEELLAYKETNRLLVLKEARGNKKLANCYPFRLWFESSTRCNFRCVMCANSYNSDPGTDIIIDAFEALKDNVFPALSYIDLQGQGEPLLSRNFDLFYKYAVKNLVTPTFITNGSLLTEKRMRSFVLDGAQIYISMDGVTQKIYQELRPDGDVEAIQKKIETMSKWKGEFQNSKCKIGIFYILTSNNIYELHMLVEKCALWGVDSIWVHELDVNPIGDPNVRKLVLSLKEKEDFIKVLEKAQTLAENKNVSLALPHAYDIKKRTNSKLKSHDTFDGNSSSKNKYPGFCIVPWANTYVDVRGKVRPCCASFEIMGDLQKQTFEDIWNCKAYQELRTRVNSADPPDYCKQCWTWFGINLGSPPKP